jgi:hypothetical protein
MPNLLNDHLHPVYPRYEKNIWCLRKKKLLSVSDDDDCCIFIAQNFFSRL